jgi:hypothetical protein
MKKKSWLNKRANKYLISALGLLLSLSILCAFIGFYIGWMFSIRDTIMICSGIFIGSSLCLILLDILQIKFLPRMAKYKGFVQGAIGEASVADALKERLDKGNLIIDDVELEENMGNIDHIVIGRHGIFVIETKTHRGKIICDGDNWTQYKKIKENNIQIELKHSPSIQARSNAGRLSSFLNQSYPKLSDEWIKAIVVFPNKQSEGDHIEVKNEPQNCKICKSVDETIDYIEKGKISIELTLDDLSKLEEIFMPISTDTMIKD